MPRRPIAAPVLDLLLLTRPLIAKLPETTKKAALMRAWINSMNSEGAAMLDLDDEGRLPTNPKTAVRLLMVECLQIAKAEGMDGADLAEFFNGVAERGGVVATLEPDEAIRRCTALLGILQAQHMAAKLPEAGAA